MEKLNQIIESMAYAKFQNDSCPIKRNEFIMENATLGEFIDYFQTRKTSDGTSWHDRYHDLILGKTGGLNESFVKDVLWPKLKDNYIEEVVKGLENKLDAQYKVTIEQI